MFVSEYILYEPSLVGCLVRGRYRKDFLWVGGDVGSEFYPFCKNGCVADFRSLKCVEEARKYTYTPTGIMIKYSSFGYILSVNPKFSQVPIYAVCAACNGVG